MFEFIGILKVIVFGLGRFIWKGIVVCCFLISQFCWVVCGYCVVIMKVGFEIVNQWLYSWSIVF